MMQRNEVTTAKMLSPGDCFYRAGDKKKRVLQFIAESGVLNESTVCQADFAGGQFESAKNEILKSNTPVVYLRSKQLNI